MGIVAIADGTRSIRNAVDEALVRAKFSIDSDVPIIIKPNLCCIKGPETGATTDPLVVQALIDYIKREYGRREFFIVESEATALNAVLAFKLLRYEKLAKELGAKTVNLTSVPFKVTSFPDNYILHKVKIPDLFVMPHFLISVGKLKAHSLCNFTGTLKNVYGCNPEPLKAKYHSRLHEVIADLAGVFRPNFSIVDSVIAMSGFGPVAGVPLKIGKIVAGQDPVAVDAFASKLLGLNPYKINYLALAAKRGIGQIEYELASPTMQIGPFLDFKQPLTDRLTFFASRIVQVWKGKKSSRY